MKSDFGAKKYQMTRFRWKKVIPIRFYNKPLLITDFGGYFCTETEFLVLVFLITNFWA